MSQLGLKNKGLYISIVSIFIFSLPILSTTSFAQQMSFIATLSGKNLSPPVSTTAAGTAKFTLDQSGNMAYELDVKNINGVIGAHVSLKNGTDLAQVFNPYVEIAGKSEIPTGQVNGILAKGVLGEHDLSGTLLGRNMTDLATLMKNGSVNVVVRTQAHENGEIQGAVTPASLK
jgi:hypothetical protein